jgi:8-hydroxy-5-deazaflavin:NADPH oxidoreductase
MKIGILGAGKVGKALGSAWVRNKHEVMHGAREGRSNTGDVHSGSIDEAARFGDVVVVALPWQAAYDLLSSLDLNGKTAIDCTNPGRAAPTASGHPVSGSEALQARAPGAKMVKTFNITGAINMENPSYGGEPLAMFYCGR